MQNEDDMRQSPLQGSFSLPNLVTLRAPSSIAANTSIAQKPNIVVKRIPRSPNRKGAMSPSKLSQVEMTLVRKKNVSPPSSPANWGGESKAKICFSDEWIDQLIPTQEELGDNVRQDSATSTLPVSGSVTETPSTNIEVDSGFHSSLNSAFHDPKERSACEMPLSQQKSDSWVEFAPNRENLGATLAPWHTAQYGLSLSSRDQTEGSSTDCSKSENDDEHLSFSDLVNRSNTLGVSARFSTSNSGSTKDRLERSIGVPSIIYLCRGNTNVSPTANGGHVHVIVESSSEQHKGLHRYSRTQKRQHKERPSRPQEAECRYGRPVREITFERRVDKEGRNVDDDCSEITHPLYGTIQKAPLRKDGTGDAPGHRF